MGLKLFRRMLLFLAVLMLTGAVYGDEKEIASIIVGGDRNFPPYQFLDNGNPAGFNIDIMREVANVIGLKVEFSLTTWRDAMDDLKNGRIHAIAGMVFIKERLDRYDFSTPYAEDSFGLFVRKGSPIHSYADTRGKEIMVRGGGVMQEILEREGRVGRIVPVRDPEEALTLLASGRHDGAVLSKIQGFYFIEKLRLKNIRHVGEDIHTMPYCIAVKKGDTALIHKLNEGLNILKASGKYKEIYEKWFAVYERKSYYRIIRNFAILLAVLLTLLVASYLWSLFLRRLIRQRTAEIRRELKERKRAEEALADVQNLLLASIEQTPVGIIIADAPDVKYRLVNSEAEEIFGETKTSIVGNSLLHSSPEWQGFHPDGTPYKIEDIPIVQAITQGNTAKNVEWKVRHAGGKEYWVLTNAAPIRNAAGEIIAGVSIFMDITERKRAEEVRESLRRLSQRLTEAVSMRDVGKVIAEESHCLFGHDFFSLYLYNEVKRFSEGIYSEDTPLGASAPVETLPINLSLEVLKKSRAYTGKATLFNRIDDTNAEGFIPVGEKERRSLSLMFSPVRWGERSIGVITVQSYTKGKYGERDLEILETFAAQCSGALLRVHAEEDRRRLEAQIQNAQKLESLGILAGGIAHDFNNLLMGILGHAELALDAISPISPAYNNIKGLEAAAKRSAELCKQMLAYSGKGRFVIEPVNLNEIIEEMFHLLEVSIFKKIVLKFNLAQNLPLIEGDASQLSQIIMNLVTNASEAIGDKSGVINITTGAMECNQAYLSGTFLDEKLPDGVYVYLEVADTGCGMEREIRDRIFDPFFTTKFTGRGLGLPAVLGIARGHKGAIKVYSEPGRGTTIKVLFPALESTAPSTTVADESLQEWQGVGTILLIDDEDTVRTVGKIMLEKAGFDVLTASDGHEGLEIFRKELDRVACVILDLTMPYMDGEATFRELRQIKENVRVILTSGYSEKEVVSRFSGKGLAGFLQKPYRASVLIAKVREAIGASG
ncbi:MAG: transporter substrate-binding domain-containing protein [Candidatus Sumerlaeota bacterium]|nr:transporter substrate-binding domain-containing protein [Candidatus Sumerlaeota bacterium]